MVLNHFQMQREVMEGQLLGHRLKKLCNFSSVQLKSENLYSAHVEQHTHKQMAEVAAGLAKIIYYCAS